MFFFFGLAKLRKNNHIPGAPRNHYSTGVSIINHFAVEVSLTPILRQDVYFAALTYLSGVM